jgi:hypothetical protein
MITDNTQEYSNNVLGTSQIRQGKDSIKQGRF